MAKPDKFEKDKEKRALAEARTAEAQTRTQALKESQQTRDYARKLGYPDLPTATAAESAREKAVTNKRLTDVEAVKNRLEAKKALAAAAIPGTPHHQAALDAIAQEAGVTVPKAVDPATEKANKIRASKGLPPLGESGGSGEVKTGDTTGQVAPTGGNESIFRPDYTGYGGAMVDPRTRPIGPVPATEAGYGSPVTPHLGLGGGPITAENPTGNPDNPWGAGGLLDNPTHRAAMRQQAIQDTMFPTGPVSPGSRILYPGEPQDIIARQHAAQTNPVRPAAPATAPAPAGGGFMQAVGDIFNRLMTPTAPVGSSRTTGNILPSTTAPAPAPFVPPPWVQPPQPTWANVRPNIDIDAALRAQAAQMQRRTNF